MIKYHRLNLTCAFFLGHCDTVHAVEAHHGGLGDSSVLYIPAVPLTVHKSVRMPFLINFTMFKHFPPRAQCQLLA